METKGDVSNISAALKFKCLIYRLLYRMYEMFENIVSFISFKYLVLSEPNVYEPNR